MTCSLVAHPRETPDVRRRGWFLLAGALLWAALPGALRAQGGWRQWDVYLRDGTRVEANPLGAPDDAHIAISVGGVRRFHFLDVTDPPVDWFSRVAVRHFSTIDEY